MRLGVYGLGREGAPGDPWPTLAASLGAGAGAVIDRATDALDGRGAAAAPPWRWDALLVCAALSSFAGMPDQRTEAAVEAGALPGPLRALVTFARAGGAVLGLAGGFRSLCALGLLPGRVMPLATDGEPPPPPRAHLRVEGRSTPFTSAIPAGRVISLAGPSAALGLRYEVVEPATLEARGQVIFRYCDLAGGTRALSRSPIAGVCGEAGNVVGLLAGPEALAGDGTQLLGSLRMHLAGKR